MGADKAKLEKQVRTTETTPTAIAKGPKGYKKPSVGGEQTLMLYARSDTTHAYESQRVSCTGEDEMDELLPTRI